MLKRLVILAAMALALSPVAGCAQISGAVGKALPAVATSFTQTSVVDEKALIAAETAYNVPAQAYLVANRHGLLTPALKGQIKPKLQMAKQALNLAREAYKAGDAKTLGEQIGAVQRLASEARALIPTPSG